MATNDTKKMIQSSSVELFDVSILEVLCVAKIIIERNLTLYFGKKLIDTGQIAVRTGLGGNRKAIENVWKGK
jgi:hypothetical protein